MARAIISSNLSVSAYEVEASSRRILVKYILGSTGFRDSWKFMIFFIFIFRI